MGKQNPRNVLRTAGLVLAALAAMVLYVFISSAIQGRNTGAKTDEMYGVDSITYTGKPVIKVYVWQKNHKNPDDYPSQTEKNGVNDRMFYDLVPLTLREGETLTTSQDLSDDTLQNTYTALTVVYDGEISGEYQIPGRGFLYYAGGNDRIPAKPLNQGGGNSSDFSSGDGRFSLNKTGTLEFPGFRSQINYRSDEDIRTNLKKQMGESGYDILSHLSTEKLTEVYPDAPAAMNGLYRYQVTSRLTLWAKHPTKTDVTVAELVLEIKEYSVWRWEDTAALALLRESDYPNQAYSEITVISYTQSDAFAFE